MVIYADVVFFINFVMNTFILFLTSIIVKKQVQKRLLFLGGLLGSFLYCMLMFYEPIAKYYNSFTSLITFLLPLVVVFKPKDIRTLLQTFIILNICAFFIGGVTTAFFFYTNANNYIGDLIVFTVENFSFKFLLFSCSFTYVSIKIARIIFIEKIIEKKRIMNIRASIKGKNINFNALVDTGNTLKTPSDNHIIITEFEIIKEFLPNDVKLYFYEKEKNIEKLYSMLENLIIQEPLMCFNIVPFKSIGNENGFIMAFKADEIYIYDEKDKCIKNDVYIGIADFSLSSGEEFNALINPKIFE